MTAIMAAFPTFPLFGLPDDVVLRTIRVMILEQKLAFSLISDKCKGLVKTIQIKGTSISVSIEKAITIFINTVSIQTGFSYYTEPGMYWGEGAYGQKKKLTPPQTVRIETSEVSRTFEFRKRDFTMKTWLEHLQNVFNYHKIDSISFLHFSSEFDLDDIKELFGNITRVTIEDSKIPKSLLMQNFDILNFIESGWDVPITLNDLLLIDSKVITVENPQLPQKLLNNFIKLWQRGSNPHVEYLRIDYFDDEENDEKIIMKGIKHEVNPLSRRRYFKSVGFEYPMKICGGMDIYRMDGVNATITYEMSHEFSSWEIFVWMDHCIVE